MAHVREESVGRKVIAGDGTVCAGERAQLGKTNPPTATPWLRRGRTARDNLQRAGITSVVTADGREQSSDWLTDHCDNGQFALDRLLDGCRRLTSFARRG